MMKKCYFGAFDGDYWPTPEQLAPYFFSDPPWLFEGGNDSWALDIAGLNGTGQLPFEQQVQIHLSVCGRSDVGIWLQYRWSDGRGNPRIFYSRGDLENRLTFIRTGHDDLLSLGLFISFESGWRGVKEFVDTDGKLPKAVEWISSDELPAGTFPVGDRALVARLEAEGRIR